jgi:hypothetical protein
MKDELKGQMINEGYFLGPQKYGYYITNSEGIKQEFSVFSGVPRNSLTFEEVKTIFNGTALNKTVDKRFYKSFNTLNIDIRTSKITIKNKPVKDLVDNIYLPQIINSGYFGFLNKVYNKYNSVCVLQHNYVVVLIILIFIN